MTDKERLEALVDLITPTIEALVGVMDQLTKAMDEIVASVIRIAEKQSEERTADENEMVAMLLSLCEEWKKTRAEHEPP